MRTVIAGFLILAAGVAGRVTAADGLTGSWRSYPIPERGELVLEFFADGTGLVTIERDSDMSRSFRVLEKKPPGSFELIVANEGVWATFEVKAPGVAVLTTENPLRAIRMIPGGFDD
jgi:hypothetical protein